MLSLLFISVEGQCNTNSVLSCCDEQCLGGCSENTNADCNVCKRFTNHGQCVARCPPGMFEVSWSL